MQSLSEDSRMRFFGSLLVVFAVIQLGCCYMDRQAMSRLIRKLKDEHYLREMMPQLEYRSNGEENPLTVTVNAYVRAITGLDTTKGRLGVQMTFRQEWTDSRFTSVCADAFPAKDGDESARNSCAQLYGEDVDMAWHPDTFFRNEAKSFVHDDLVRNDYLRFYPDGELVNSQRITAWLICPEAIGAVQDQEITCKLQAASWGFSSQDIIYEWKEEEPFKFTETNDGLTELTTGRCDVTTDTGTYSCLEATFKIKVDFEKAPHYRSESDTSDN